MGALQRMRAALHAALLRNDRNAYDGMYHLEVGTSSVFFMCVLVGTRE